MDIHEIYNLILESTMSEFSGAGIIVCTKDNKVLLLKKKRRFWTFPGGKPENDELPKQTAIRETKEETGLIFTNLKKPIIITNKNKIYYSYIGVIPEKTSITLSSEHKSYNWVNLKKLGDMNMISPFKENIQRIVDSIYNMLN